LERGYLGREVDDGGREGMVEAFGDNNDLALGVDQVESAKDPREDADADAEFIDDGECEFDLLEKENRILLVGPGLVANMRSTTTLSAMLLPC
jgi:hypothetical protein